MPKNQTKSLQQQEEQLQEDSSSSVASLDIAACSICHSSLDYSDRAAFFKADRWEDYQDDDSLNSYVFRPTDPYLSISWYNPSNALVYCDSCNRLYHQQCHPVPLIVLPRGTWHCLLCQSHAHYLNSSSRSATSTKKKKKKHKNIAVDSKLQHFFQNCSMEQVFSTSCCSAPQDNTTTTQHWFQAAANLIATQTHQLFTTKLRQAILQQLANLRLTATAMETWNFTHTNRRHLAKANSQAVVDTAVKAAACKYKLHLWMQAVEQVRNYQAVGAPEQVWKEVVEWCKQQEQETTAATTTPTTVTTTTTDKNKQKQQQLPLDFVRRVIFPFGIPTQNHFAPRTPEAVAQDNTDNDDDISLDDLTCCVCKTQEATDENDLLMCDGHGCFRAFHMQCVHPTVGDISSSSDWFCPYCTGVADLLHLIQSEYMGDDWELQRRNRKRKQQQKASPNDNDDDDDDSLQSWTRADQVFPQAKWEHETALLLQSGTRNAETDALLSTIFGWEMISNNDNSNNNNDDDDDNVEEDEHFDLDAFHEERRRERQEQQQQGSSSSAAPSSQATLADMSSVELEIDNNELEALSDAHDDDSDDDDDDGGGDDEESNDQGGFENAGGHRRSRRLLRRQQQQEDSDSNRDPGKLDEANIVKGKRARKPVDYIKLNNAIFGDLSDGEAANLDDTDDFRNKKRSDDSSDDEEDDDEGASSTRETSGEEENDESQSSNSGDEGSTGSVLEKAVRATRTTYRKTKRTAAPGNGSLAKTKKRPAKEKQSPPHKRQKTQTPTSKADKKRTTTADGVERKRFGKQGPQQSINTKQATTVTQPETRRSARATKPTRKDDDSVSMTTSPKRRGTASIARKAINFVASLVSSSNQKS